MSEVLRLSFAAFLGITLGAVVGAVVGIVVYYGGERGERRRFDGELAPLRASIADVADRFDHWTKRERRRDVLGSKPVEPGSEPGAAPLTRAEQLRQVATKFAGRS